MEEINLKELFSYFLSKIWIVILTLIIALLTMYTYNTYIQIPLYKSTTSLILVSKNGEITQNDVTLNQKLVSTYREIIKSRRVLDQVVNNLNLDSSWQEIQSHISVSTESSTEIIRISVSDEDAVIACAVANEIAKVFSSEIVNIYNIDNVTILEYPVESSVPYNIDKTKQMLLATLVGMVIGSGIIFILFYFDTTIKSSEDIEKKLGLIVLGNVPKSKTTGNKKIEKQEEKTIKEEAKKAKKNIGKKGVNK